MKLGISIATACLAALVIYGGTYFAVGWVYGHLPWPHLWAGLLFLVVSAAGILYARWAWGRVVSSQTSSESPGRHRTASDPPTAD